MAKRRTEEVYAALNIIKDLCNEHECECKGCPLRNPNNDTRCGIDNGYPKFWKIHEPEVWRAFVEV